MENMENQEMYSEVTLLIAKHCQREKTKLERAQEAKHPLEALKILLEE